MRCQRARIRKLSLCMVMGDNPGCLLWLVAWLAVIAVVTGGLLR